MRWFKAVVRCGRPLALFALAWNVLVPSFAASQEKHEFRSAAVRSLLSIRQQHVVIQKWDLSCGAAALATLLTYQHGDPVAEKQVAEGMLRRTDPLRVKYRGGFSLLDMKRFTESRGYKAAAYAGLAVENLVDFAPIIVPIQSLGYAHFVIFRGLVGDRWVALADPAWGNRTMSIAEFETAWVDRVGFVIERRDKEPPPNRLVVRPSDRLLPSDADTRAPTAADADD